MLISGQALVLISHTGHALIKWTHASSECGSYSIAVAANVFRQIFTNHLSISDFLFLRLQTHSNEGSNGKGLCCFSPQLTQRQAGTYGREEIICFVLKGQHRSFLSAFRNAVQPPKQWINCSSLVILTNTQAACCWHYFSECWTSCVLRKLHFVLDPRRLLYLYIYIQYMYRSVAWYLSKFINIHPKSKVTCLYWTAVIIL